MADRMRANRTVAGSYTTDIDDAFVSSYATNCESGACTPDQLAGWDVNEWKGLIEQLLPTGRGSVVQNGAIFSLTVQFVDTRLEEDTEPHAVNITVQP